MRPTLADQRLHRLRRQLLAERGPGGAGDRFVHQRAAEIVRPGREAGLGAARAHLDPGGLDVGDLRMQREARDRVHQQRLAPGRAAARPALQIDRRLHVHERQRHQLGEAAGLGLQRADAQQVPRPVVRLIDMAEHDGRGAAQAQRHARSRITSSHCAVVILSGQMHPAHLVVQDLGRGARQRAEAGALQLGEELAERDPERLRALPDLERREGVDVDLGRRLLHRPADLEIGLARCSRDGCRPAGTSRSRRAAQASRVRRAISSRSRS